MAFRAVSVGADDKVDGGGVRVDLVLVAGQVGLVGKGAGAYVARLMAIPEQVAGAGKGYPGDLRSSEGDAEVLVVGCPSQNRVSACIYIDPFAYVGGAVPRCRRAFR